MAYQPLWVIYYQRYPCRRTVVKLFNPQLEEKGAHAFLTDISQKVILIVWLEFKLAYYDVTVQLFNHYTMEMSQDRLV